MTDQPVYSTKTGSSKKRAGSQTNSKSKSYCISAGPTKMRLESKGRRGKSVTLLWNMPLSEQQVLTLKKQLQEQLGCGATLKGSELELQGDRREQVERHFCGEGWKIQRAGG